MNKTQYGWFIVAALILAVGIRLFLVFTYQPLYGNDAPSYAALAGMMSTGDFTKYDGVRTPGYPLFMMMLRYNNQWIRIAQNIAGILNLLLVYVLARKFLSSKASAFLLFLMAVSIQFPFYEEIIQTEALAALAVSASVYLFLFPGQHPKTNLFWASAIASVGALVRPHLVILPPLYGTLYLAKCYAARRMVWRELGAIIFPAAVLIGGWIAFNYVTISRITFTTLPKADIMAHMIPYVKDADDKFGVVKQAYVEAYDAMREKVELADDNRAGYVSFAGHRLTELGLAPSLERRDIIHNMAVDLIRKHPLGYAKNVLWAWGRFWRIHIIVYQECFAPNSSSYDFMMRLWRPIKVVWLVVNGLFLLMIPIWPFLPISSERRYVLLVLYAIALAASVSQALTQYYDSARFAVPFQPLVVLAVAVVVTAIWENWVKSGPEVSPRRGGRAGE